MKRFLSVMLAALALGTAYGKPTDRLITQPAVATTQCQSKASVSVDTPSERLEVGQVAKRECDYKCLADCKDGCKSIKDNREYNLCLDQCQGRCDCR